MIRVVISVDSNGNISERCEGCPHGMDDFASHTRVHDLALRQNLDCNESLTVVGGQVAESWKLKRDGLPIPLRGTVSVSDLIEEHGGRSNSSVAVMGGGGAVQSVLPSADELIIFTTPGVDPKAKGHFALDLGDWVFTESTESRDVDLIDGRLVAGPTWGVHYLIRKGDHNVDGQGKWIASAQGIPESWLPV